MDLISRELIKLPFFFPLPLDAQSLHDTVTADYHAIGRQNAEAVSWLSCAASELLRRPSAAAQHTGVPASSSAAAAEPLVSLKHHSLLPPLANNFNQAILDEHSCSARTDNRAKFNRVTDFHGAADSRRY